MNENLKALHSYIKESLQARYSLKQEASDSITNKSQSVYKKWAFFRYFNSY